MASNPKVKALKYAFKEGARYSIDAQKAGEELERIERKAKGPVTPPAVVKAARPEDAVLHPAFEWRDPVAAEQFRLYQARRLIRSIHVVIEPAPELPPVHLCPTSETKPKTRSGWVHADGGYHATDVIVQRPDLYAIAVREAQARVHAAEAALKALHDAAIEAEDTDSERLTRIAIAVQAMETASAAVQALH